MVVFKVKSPSRVVLLGVVGRRGLSRSSCTLDHLLFFLVRNLGLYLIYTSSRTSDDPGSPWPLSAGVH